MRSLGAMDLEEIRGFLAVVETGSMLGAATRLGVPRGTLRRRIDALEARAGVPLLERSAQGMTVTAAGRLLAQRGRTFLEQGAALLAAARELGRGPKGTLRIHLPIGLPPSSVVGLMKLDGGQAPRREITARICEDPLAGRLEDVDIAIYFGAREPPASWSTITLWELPVRVLASPEYLARHGSPRTLAELGEHSLAAWVESGDTGRRWPLRRGGIIKVEPQLVSNDAHLLREYTRRGMVMALLPDASLDLPWLPVDGFVCVLDDEVEGRVGLHLAIPEHMAEDPKLTQFVGMLQRAFALSDEAVADELRGDTRLGPRR